MSKATAVTLLWRWLSGAALDGRLRTNATWTMPSRGPRPVLTQTGHAVRWHHMPRMHRAGIRTGTTLLLLLIAWGLLAAFWVTVILLAAATTAGLAAVTWHVVHRVRTWSHERHYVRPLERTLTAAIGATPVSIEIEREDDTVKSVAIEWAPDTEIRAEQKQAALDAVTTRLALEAPDNAWQLKGRNRSVVFTQSEPPPSYVEWNDRLAAAVRQAASNELVFGIGKRDAINSAKYSQSPHLMIPGESGGGKSNLAAFLLLQEMMRGSLIFNLDPKWISHLWLQGLPNVINAHDPEDLHLALCWLGKELIRRTKAAYYSAGGTGRVRGRHGCRIIVLAEELNYGMPGIKNLWQEILAQDKKLRREDRDPNLPKQSPAIASLSAIACAGRASDYHEWLIAQLMTVDSTGVKDSTIRANAGLKAMARWGAGWHLAVGKHIPMPPPSDIPGRIQLVTGDGVRETQVPYLHLDDPDEAVAEEAVRWARDLAVSGTVALIPSDVPERLWPASVLGHERPAITAGEDIGTCPDVPVPPPLMTLPEAYATGMFGDRNYEAVRKAAQRRLQPAGTRRGANEYDFGDLQALVRR